MLRAPLLGQGKAHTAGNGRPFPRGATPHWPNGAYFIHVGAWTKIQTIALCSAIGQDRHTAASGVATGASDHLD